MRIGSDGRIHMNIRHMSYFIALAEEMNYSRASVKLGVSQPTLTQTIQKLEQSLGAELFEKNSKGLKLTEEGQIFLSACRNITDIYADTISRIENLRKGIAGTINLGMAPSRAPYTLPSLLESFEKQYPNVRVNVSEFLTAETEEGLVNGRLDLGVAVVNGIMKPELEYVPIITEQVLLAMNLRMAADAGRPVPEKDAGRAQKADIEAFTGLPFILLGDEQLIARLFTEYCEKRKFAFDTASRCRTVETGLALANSGRGIALVTSTSVEYYRKCFPDLRFFSVDEKELSRDVYVITRKGKALSEAERALITIIKEKSSDHE